MRFRQYIPPSGAPQITRPEISSDDTEIIGIYRRCYPPDLVAQGQVGFRISVTEWGWVHEATIIAGSGDPRVDEAGLCVIKALRFTPARRSGLPVRSTLAWQILVRPPPPL